MINGLDIFYLKANKGSGLKIVENKANGLKLIKGRGCYMTKNNTNKKSQKGSGLKILKQYFI